MSAIIIGGNEIIPDTLTVTVDGTEITAKDFQKVLLNINQASATASVADGTDLMQKMEIINKNANACDVSFKGEGGATVKNLKQNQSMRLSWTGSYWYVTFGGLLSGVANDGTPFNYTTEVTLDEVPVNTVYSTTEQDTGMTWIDGKPIYRKVYSWTTSSTSGTNTTQNLPANVNVVVNFYGFILADDYSRLPINCIIAGASYGSAEILTGVGGNSSGPTIIFNRNTFARALGRPIWVTIEYTKTTD